MGRNNKDKLSSNPAEAARKAARQRELKKNKDNREKSREFALVKKDTKSIEAEIRQLEQQQRGGNNGAGGTERLEALKDELQRAKSAKEKYLKEHPEHKKFVYPHSASEQQSQQQQQDTGTGLFRPDGKPRYPERSVYYDPVFNPWGNPPPGLPYREKPPHEWASTSVVQREGDDGDESDDDDDGIVMPAGPPPGASNAGDGDSDGDDSDDDIVMPAGPPPGQQHVQQLGGYNGPPPGGYSGPPPPPPGGYTGPPPPPPGGYMGPPPPPPPGGYTGPPPPGGAFTRPPPMHYTGPPAPRPYTHNSPFPPPSAPRHPIGRPNFNGSHRPPPQPHAHRPPGPQQSHTISVSARPTTSAATSATISSAPKLRDLKKEAVAFLPPSVRKQKAKEKERAKMAGLGSRGVVANPDVEEEQEQVEQEEDEVDVRGSADDGREEEPIDQVRMSSPSPSSPASAPAPARAPAQSTTAPKSSLVGYYDDSDDEDDDDEDATAVQRTEQEPQEANGARKQPAARVNLVEALKFNLPPPAKTSKGTGGTGTEEYEKYLASLGDLL